MSAPRSDYRERIRLARERVQAAAAEEEEGNAKGRKDGSGQTRQEQHMAAQILAPGPGPSQSTQGKSLAPQQASVSAPTQSRDQKPISAPPPRPYRPDHNSWFATGSTPTSNDTRQMIQSYGHQSASRSLIHPIYPQSEFREEIVHDGPGQQSYIVSTPSSHHASHHASHNSSISSIGDIPDFPVPQPEEDYQLTPQSFPQPPQPAQTRRSNLGPPPSASSRRATSSLYSRNHSYVSPIPEESPQSTPRRERFSTIAASEQSLDPVFEQNEHTFLADASDKDSHRKSDPDTDLALISPGLIRQASLGRKAKPSLTLVRSGSNSIKKGISPGTASGAITPTTAGQSAARASSQIGLAPFSPEPPLPIQTAVSSEHGDPLSHPSSARSISPMTPVVEKILGGLEKGGAIPTGIAAPRVESMQPVSRQQSEFAKRAEERVSTTSLADLIRRATKVRTNLDRGRTASRLGMLDMFNRSKDRLAQHEKANRASTSDSFSGMIGWLPPHAQGEAKDVAFLETELEEGGPSRRAIKAKVRKDRRKRCCGMPQWLFVLVLLLAIICIAAAIIIPVELLVVPHQSESAGVTLTSCPATNQCQNSGASVVVNGTCSCACINGWTGKHCDQVPDSTCASNLSAISSISGNLTMGKNIPRLIQGSQTNFSINLNATAIVGIFSLSTLSCSDENGLVTWQDTTRRRAVAGLLNAGIPPPTNAPKLPYISHRGLHHRDEASNSGPALALDTGSPGGPSPTANMNATGTGNMSPTATPVISVDIRDYYDFARVAVLFILQHTADIAIAEQAHAKLNSIFMSKIFAPQNVQVTDGVAVDLTRTIVTVNGYTEGVGKPIP